ncbi:MAG TPA: hypothetical protein VFB36_09265 [Nevskiaceae bacterium]|nr:hypothetical protein [Nevskiaceae bacterium]
MFAGCATETRHPVTGPPLKAVTEDEARTLLNDLRLDLKEVSLAQIGGHALEPRVADGQLFAELSQAALFEQGNAQVRAEALKALAEIAEDVGARGGCVAHVIAFAAADADADLAERRAASIADDFAHHSIAPSRLRFEARVDDKRADHVLVVLKPVIIGRESPAWKAPVLSDE